MPIGKDSITKRVAKTEIKDENIAPELVATTGVAQEKAPAKKAPAKKTTSGAKSTGTKSANTKSTATKKTVATAEKKAEKPADVNTGVLSNVAPETVEAVIGHKENEKYEKVSVGDKMPNFLL